MCVSMCVLDAAVVAVALGDKGREEGARQERAQDGGGGIARTASDTPRLPDTRSSMFSSSAPALF